MIIILDALRQIDFEHKVLIILYILSYLGAMLIQVRDSETHVSFMDWLLAFITSLVGGIITYYGVMSWANLGIRMGVTIFSTLVSYRVFKFVLSKKSQDQFASGFWNGIMNGLRRMFNNFDNESDRDNDRGNG